MINRGMKIRIKNLEIGDGCPVRVMGVLNISKESFYKDSVVEPANIASRAKKMVDAGATMLDVGGRSTAPFSPPITVDEELSRVKGALEALFKGFDDEETLISIDTQYRRVAEAAFKVFETHGREKQFVLNDVSGLNTDETLAAWCAQVGCPVILMASHERPGDSLGIEETIHDLESSIEHLENAGMDTSQKIIVDPAIGKWIPKKEPSYDVELCARLQEFRVLNRPILVAISRKSFIGALIGEPDPAKRLQGTLAATAIAVFNGAHVVRTHDVSKETMDTIKVAQAIRDARRADHD